MHISTQFTVAPLALHNLASCPIALSFQEKAAPGRQRVFVSCVLFCLLFTPLKFIVKNTEEV